MVVLNEITKTAVVSNGVRERNAAMESELKKSVLVSSGNICPNYSYRLLTRSFVTTFSHVLMIS